MATIGDRFADRQLGFDVVSLSMPLQRSRWIRRKVETVTFIDAQTIRRETAFHIDLSHIRLADGTYPAQFGDGILLPLASLRREIHPTLELRDASGVELPRFTRSEERSVAGAGLAALAQIITGSDEFATELVDLIEAAPGTRSLGQLLGRRGYETLKNNEIFPAVAQGLLRNYMLLAVVPSDTFSQRALLRMSHLDRLDRTVEGLGSRLFLSISPNLVVDVEARGVSECHSYHVEVSAPEDLQIGSAGLFLLKAGGETEFIPDDDLHPGTAHVHHAWTTAVSRATVTIECINNPVGLVRQAAFAVLLISAELVIGALGLWVHHWNPTLDRGLIGSTDPASATTLLLLVPGVLATYAARPREHPFASWTLFPARCAAIAASLACFVAAGSIAFHLRGGALRWTWAATSAIAVAAGAKLVLECFSLARRRRRR